MANPRVHEPQAAEVTDETNMGDLIDRHPAILEVLEEYGIRMDPATYILLRGTVREAAEYNAILDFDEFRHALSEQVRRATRDQQQPPSARADASSLST